MAHVYQFFIVLIIVLEYHINCKLDNSSKEKEFVHVPAVNMGEMKETEKVP